MLLALSFDMSLGSGLFYGTLVICLAIMSLKLLDVALCGLRRTLQFLRDCWVMFLESGAAEPEPVPPARTPKSARGR